MSPDPARLRRPITEFNFKPLFVEELGWDDVRTAPLIVYVNDQPFTLKALAQKRGLLLLLCPAMPAELGIGDPRAAFAYNLLAVAVRRLPSRWLSFTMAGSQSFLADLPMLSTRIEPFRVQLGLMQPDTHARSMLRAGVSAAYAIHATTTENHIND